MWIRHTPLAVQYNKDFTTQVVPTLYMTYCESPEYPAHEDVCLIHIRCSSRRCGRTQEKHVGLSVQSPNTTKIVDLFHCSLIMSAYFSGSFFTRGFCGLLFLSLFFLSSFRKSSVFPNVLNPFFQSFEKIWLIFFLSEFFATLCSFHKNCCLF